MAWHVPLSLQSAGQQVGTLRFVEDMDLAIARSIRRAARHGRVRGLCLMVHGATDTRWWRTLAATSEAICFVRGRPLLGDTGHIGLFGPILRRGGCALGQHVLYFGAHADRFLAVFHAQGVCSAPMRRRSRG